MERVDREKFVIVRGARRVWAIGAIHGEAERLVRLHEQLGERFAPGDRVVYLGNFLGHGPWIRDTVDELILFRRSLLAQPGMMACDVAYLRGSQEEMWHKLLQLHLAIDPPQVIRWMMDHGVCATLEAYGSTEDIALTRARSGARDLARWTNELREAMQRRPGHVELMTALRRAAFTAEGSLLFVHAGIDPTRPLDAQEDTFWWGGAGFGDLSQPYGGFKKVVRGFDPTHPGIRISGHTATIDAGAGFGGPLAAACFDLEGELADQIES